MCVCAGVEPGERLSGDLSGLDGFCNINERFLEFCKFYHLNKYITVINKRPAVVIITDKIR